MKIVRIGIDLAKNIFHLHGVDEHGKRVFSKQLKRKQVLPYLANIPECEIGMEACGGSHYWARSIMKLGHKVKMMAPQYVKPYVAGNKNDANDAAGICEAMSRPHMRFVEVKTVEQQDMALLHRIRSRAVRDRSALVNQVRGLLAEYGIAISKGISQVRNRLPDILEDGDNELSGYGRELFHSLYLELVEMDKRIGEMDKQLKRIANETKACQRLQTVPGLGPVVSGAIYSHIGNASQFKNGRQLAAYLGLVPKQHSSGGKDKLLGISKRGNVYVRTLIIHGARSVVNAAVNKTDPLSQWLNELVKRRGKNIATVALANKNARTVWAILTKEEVYKAAV
jgi:transposase